MQVVPANPGTNPPDAAYAVATKLIVSSLTRGCFLPASLCLFRLNSRREKATMSRRKRSPTELRLWRRHLIIYRRGRRRERPARAVALGSFIGEVGRGRGIFEAAAAVTRDTFICLSLSYFILSTS